MLVNLLLFYFIQVFYVILALQKTIVLHVNFCGAFFRDPWPLTRNPWPVTFELLPLTRYEWPLVRYPWPLTCVLDLPLKCFLYLSFIKNCSLMTISLLQKILHHNTIQYKYKSLMILKVEANKNSDTLLLQSSFIYCTTTKKSQDFQFPSCTLHWFLTTTWYNKNITQHHSPRLKGLFSFVFHKSHFALYRRENELFCSPSLDC